MIFLSTYIDLKKQKLNDELTQINFEEINKTNEDGTNLLFNRMNEYYNKTNGDAMIVDDQLSLFYQDDDDKVNHSIENLSN